MAKGRMDANHRPNTLKENKMVLNELRSRGKPEHRASHELNKLFAKLNWESAPKHWKNGKAAVGSKQEKMPAEHPYGPVEGFPPGSWWGIRMDCSRDRVHEPFNADIQDGPAGAVSLCTSHLNSHNDEDLGDALTFTGSSYEPGSQSDHPLLRSYQSQVPLRLVRSYNLTNDFAPKTGYRYDGLYTVAAHWIGVASDSERYHKFALVRVRNQEPPAWQESVNRATSSAKKTSCSQTRCTERISTTLCSESNPSGTDQEVPSGSRYRVEAVKFSFNKFASTSVVDKATPEVKRNTSDSAIVTRCISAKKAECPSSSGMIFAPYGESPVQNANRVLENPSKPAPCKLQNTNISIRTDLYDSSHNIQHDTKKSIPMTFCRTFVSARNTRVVNHSHVGTLNLNSCGPCPRDGEQESLIQSRSGISKVSATHSPCSESNRSTDRSTPKINRVGSPIEAKTHGDSIETRISETTAGVDAPACATGDATRANCLERGQRDKENSPTKTFNEIADATTGNGRNVCPITRTSSKKNAETPDANREEPREETPREQRTALDSLTPDKMLKYIVKQKYHPTAKLLIGSVIGLATGESKILRTYDSMISRKKSWSRSKKLRAAKGDATSSGNSEKSLERRPSAGEKSLKKERSVAKPATQKRGIKERIFTMRLRRTRVSKRLLGSEKKSSSKTNAEGSSDPLRRSKDSEMSQQPFSKSTSLKNSKRNAKKRRSELANLTIDANIGPKIRGLRNRRLRGRSLVFTKKRHDVDIASCCGSGRSDVGARGRKGSSRVEPPSKRSKRLNSATKTRYVQHKKREQKTETSGVQRKIEDSGSGAPSQGNMAGSSRKAEKRKVSRSQSSGRGRAGDESLGKKLCQRSEKDAATTQRVITMVDAATQCSNRRDAATCIDADIECSNGGEEPENSVKVEWIDLEDVKSESCGSDEEQFVLELANDSGGPQIACEPEIPMKPSKIYPIRPQAEKPQIANVTQRLSAFVPVNISDSDFRIARLRSIGFRPIEPVCVHHGKNQCTANCTSGSSKEPSESTVASRVADEQYNKYTSEETTMVGYMDQELRYQDIEEDVVTAKRNAKNPQTVGKTGGKVARARNKKLDIAGGANVDAIKSRRASASLEDDSEIPWHGWKKFVKDKEAHWVGW